MKINNLFHSFFNSIPEGKIHLPQKKHPENRDERINLLNTAFLINLCGEDHSEFQEAQQILHRSTGIPEVSDTALFYQKGLSLIEHEIKDRTISDPEFAGRVSILEEYLSRKDRENYSADEDREAFWSIFFPEGTGIFNEKEEREKRLREKRTVTITKLNPAPLLLPGKEIIFTSNILLTVPSASADIDSFGFPEQLTEKIKKTMTEPQIYFYDHPVQIGTSPENNEILYGLNGLDKICSWEKSHGNMSIDRKLTCILSVSVTHKGLQRIARDYIQYEINRYGSFQNLEIYIFTENNTKELIDVLVSGTDTGKDQTVLLKEVFGVDGEYGRHYSFLKAVAAFWQVFIDREKRATFKIDLDQVFPEKELKNETGKSAFEHFRTPLWGAQGRDAEGRTIELGMIAGALVNEKDIHKGIFTPDVRFDTSRNISAEERVFYSKLMMGFSTEAELMTRYGENGIDGIRNCIQRIHVTGGTNGILIQQLRKYRPFTPSFIGRAEDQCYLLSVLTKKGKKLAYLHEDGLIMRHDKEAFASEAIKAASSGSTIGDYIRILYFSKYVEILTDGNIETIKQTIDPFTGCFVSKIPITIVFLRFALHAMRIRENEGEKESSSFLLMGVKRIMEALTFIEGEASPLYRKLKREKEGWDLFYNLLGQNENNILSDNSRREKIKTAAMKIVKNCKI